jgi:hypothetical protein
MDTSWHTTGKYVHSVQQPLQLQQLYRAVTAGVKPSSLTQGTQLAKRPLTH